MAVAASAGCGDQSTQVVDPSDEPPDTTSGGQVQRAPLVVVVSPDTKGSLVAEALGWPAGRIPGARVTASRLLVDEQFEVTTDATGEVTIPDLLVGSYTVTASKILTADERAMLSDGRPDLADAHTFGGGVNVELSSQGDSAAFELVTGTPGSLVISEIYQYQPRANSGPALNYPWGQYVEVYNNADTTVYLDGKILAAAPFHVYESPEYPCDGSDPWRLDPDGLWSELHFRFPGTGTRYPLGPGEAAVVAMDAIDHTEVQDGAPDLTDADFETIGTPDVDNPGVPNMLQAGLREWDTPLGHGLATSIGAVFLAEEGDLAGLPLADLPGTYPRHRRIPAERILDVVTFLLTPALSASIPVTWCDPVLPESFDRLPARLRDESDPRSIVRKMLARDADGRVILQRTMTSAADFERAPRTPGFPPAR